MTAIVAPSALGKKGEQTLVVFWNDGVRSEYEVRKLRIACPCAGCVNEWTGDKILDPRKIPENIKPNRMFSVGRYAIAIHWSDGHTTGIFSYDYLRRLS
jgi:ATP-binding protein involved in chromosome partitioning